MNASTLNPPRPAPDEVPASTMQGLKYARLAGVATGLFLIAWAPFNAIRWGDQGPGWLLSLEFVYFIVYGILLALPWGRIAGRAWRSLFILLCVMTAGFAFLMCVDLMFQYLLSTGELAGAEGEGLYRLDAGKGRGNIAPPAFQSMLIFTSLMQAPAVYFVRNPRAMV
ncbi:MAG: hypothetical protein ACQKBV_05285 [Puniceicoccales bacterium]